MCVLTEDIDAGGALLLYGLLGTTGSDALTKDFHVDVDITLDNESGGVADEGRAGPVVGGEHAGVIRQVRDRRRGHTYPETRASAASEGLYWSLPYVR